MPMDHMTDFGPMMWPWGVFMGIMWLLLIGLVGFGVIYFLLHLVGDSEPGDTHRNRSSPERIRETPREILDRRYAEGELSREEYERMKDDLENE